MRFLLTIAGLGGFLYGVDFGVIAAAEPYMKAMGVFSRKIIAAMSIALNLVHVILLQSVPQKLSVFLMRQNIMRT